MWAGLLPRIFPRRPRFLYYSEMHALNQKPAKLVRVVSYASAHNALTPEPLGMVTPIIHIFSLIVIRYSIPFFLANFNHSSKPPLYRAAGFWLAGAAVLAPPSVFPFCLYYSIYSYYIQVVNCTNFKKILVQFVYSIYIPKVL